MSSDGSRLDSGMDWIETSERIGSLGRTFVEAMGAMVLFITGAIIAMGDAATGLVIRLFDAFGVGGEQMILAFIADPAEFIGAGFDAAAESLSGTAWSELGPFIPWVVALSVLGFLALFAFYLDRRDSDVPGLGIDLPFVGNDEEGEGLDIPIFGNSEEDD